MLGFLADCLYQPIANDLNEPIYSRTRTNGRRLSLYRICYEQQICFGIDLSVWDFDNGFSNMKIYNQEHYFRAALVFHLELV